MASLFVPPTVTELPTPPFWSEVKADPANVQFTAQGWEPIYTASPTATLVIIGQAPGIKAQESQVAWNDASGKNLRSWLGIEESVFYDPAQVALLPMDFYFPGKGKSGDKPPRKDFAPTWHPRILEQMPNVQLTLLIGQYAQKHYLGKSAQKNLTETVRAFADYGPEFMPLVHPSPLNFRWQKANPWFEEQVIPALRERVAQVLA
ncbi:MAG: uracil-DNA glycosylase family protein [Rothia sp. (in: high G+C Gram-positive bacteria)]|uniref:uracil-DNA glycosylase family protein n=1 Tax=Rothia sp. (in: high G+C Gram-positive bacteria) TaxID=1885016 RepID=UPI0026E05C66|nr:uracil-DNA glycosylase family protein [Rothia sp. (in: high G+C Gram-positive bacteria)]MDO5750106.1 uracil-DNA glycosylase family protein [Rothia sp. (in: high G+C Gram-positive bacteria)]